MSESGLRGRSREIARGAVQAHVSNVAIDLFDEDGFDTVTIEQIATAAGISVRSFHRYFATKEDVVTGDPAQLGRLACDAFRATPADAPVWESLQSAYASMLAQARRDEERSRRTVRIISSTASLRARNLEKHLLWAQMLTPLVRDRLRHPEGGLIAETIVQASLVCLDIALVHWANSTDEPVGIFLRRCFSALAVD